MIIALEHAAVAYTYGPAVDMSWGKVALSLLIFTALTLAIWLPGTLRSHSSRVNIR